MPRERLDVAAACRLLTLLLILVAMPARPGEAVSDPHPAVEGRAALALPQLGARDVALYREIFALQERAVWSRADQPIARPSYHVPLGYTHTHIHTHTTGYHSTI